MRGYSSVYARGCVRDGCRMRMLGDVRNRGYVGSIRVYGVSQENRTRRSPALIGTRVEGGERFTSVKIARNRRACTPVPVVN